MYTDRLRIYKPILTNPLRLHPMSDWTACKKRPSSDMYTCIYESTMPEDTALSLEEVFNRFNTGKHPIGFTGHSICVSDVVVIDRNGLTVAYFRDPTGFIAIENFFYRACALDGSAEFRAGYSQALKDLNTPMVPVQTAWTHSKCPRCGESFAEFEENDDGYVTRCTTMLRCPFCGQKLAWDA